MNTINLDKLSPETAAYIKALQDKVVQLENKVEQQDIRISNLTEMLVNSQKKTFGRSNEQSKYIEGEQLSFFNEAEETAVESAHEPTNEMLVAAHTRRKKRTREETTENLKHIKQVSEI